MQLFPGCPNGVAGGVAVAVDVGEGGQSEVAAEEEEHGLEAEVAQVRERRQVWVP